MRRAFTSLVCSLVVVVSLAALPSSASALLSLSEVEEISSPAVVTLYAYDQKDMLVGQGAGFFVSDRGELVTNYRLLRRAHRVLVKTSTGETLPVLGVVARSKEFELVKVLVRVEAPSRWLPLAEELPERGQRVLVVHGPSGPEGAASEGWVSAVREVPRFGHLFQLAAPASAVQMGSPVLDLEGRVVGVVSILQEASGLHIAVPSLRFGQMASYREPAPLAVLAMELPPPAKSISLAIHEVDFSREEPRPGPWGEPQEFLAQGVEAYFAGRYEEAAFVIREALRLEPANPDAHYALGMAYEAQGRWREALAAYRETLRLEPTYGMAFNSMGLAYGGLDRWEEAVGAFKEAIRLAPSYAEAHANLGQGYRRLGRWSEALSAFQRAVSLRPYFAEAHFYMGLVLERVGRPGEAMQAFQEAVKFKPDLAAAHSSLGASYLRLGHTEEGVEALQEAVRLEPADAEALNLLGALYGQMGRHEEEVRTLEQAVRAEPFYWKARSNLGVAYWRGGRMRDALDEFQRALRLKSDDATAHFYVGLIYLSLGNQGGAMKQYRVLARLDRDKASKLFLLIGDGAPSPTS